MAPQYTAALTGADAPLSETAPSTRARILAGLYLFVIIGGIVAQGFIADGLVVANDAGKTAANILANKSLYRLAFTIFMVEMAAQVATTAMFYDLLKPVNRSVARLSAIMSLVASGIKTFARVFYYAPLILLSGASYSLGHRADTTGRAGPPVQRAGGEARGRRQRRDSRDAPHDDRRPRSRARGARHPRPAARDAPDGAGR